MRDPVEELAELREQTDVVAQVDERARRRMEPVEAVDESGEVTVDPDLLDRAGVGRHTPIAIVSDAYVAPGPAAKVGTLLRGTGRRRGSSGRLALEADHIGLWPDGRK